MPWHANLQKRVRVRLPQGCSISTFHAAGHPRKQVNSQKGCAPISCKAQISRKATRHSNTSVSRIGRACRTVPARTLAQRKCTPSRKRKATRTLASSLPKLLSGLVGLWFVASFAFAADNPPTFYKDVLPILQSRCQSCHRAGEMAMPLSTYAQVKPFAAAIRDVTRGKAMPPWFADPCCGRFSNDPSLSVEQIATFTAWADAHAP